MSISRSRLVFNILLILLFFTLFFISYPASYASFFIIIAIIGVFVTAGFFINNKSKKTKGSLFAVAFIAFFLMMLIIGL